LGTSDGGYAQVVSPANNVVISHTISQAVATDPVKPQDMCLKFWVYFSGPNANSLSVILNNKVITTFDATYYSQNRWFFMRTSFIGANKNVIAFSGTTSTKEQVIAIDDINIIGRKCEAVGECDFESGKNIS
jgi:MAM domain, meprin/A5/mu